MLLSTSAVHTAFLECRPDRPVELYHGCFWEMRLVRKSKLIFGRESLESRREASRQFSVTEVTRDEEEDVSKRQDGYEDDGAVETPEYIGLDDDEDGDEVASDMRDLCSVRTESVTRKHHQLTRQRVRGRMPALPH